jgi:ABC-type Fe3+ transport system permease subunit
MGGDPHYSIKYIHYTILINNSMQTGYYNNNKTFLEWWWFFCSLILITFISWKLEVFEAIWSADQTKLSFIILSLFTVMSLYCGRQAWVLSKIQKENLPLDPSFKSRYEFGWFASEICLTLGLIGTVSGFILMLYGVFADLNVNDTDSVQQSLKNMSFGMSTALYTTLVGLIAGLVLKLQYFRLEVHFDNYVKLKTNEKRTI